MADVNNKFYMDLASNLKIDCEKCFGFCCSALYFAKAEGFPEDKVAGKPCMNLKEDFKCKINESLSKKRVKRMQLHEMLWYLAEAYRIERKDKEREAIKKIIDETINFKKSIDLHAA